MRTAARRFRALVWLLASAGLQGCAAAPQASSAPTPTPAPAGPAEARLQDRHWGVLRSEAMGLKLALPEARAWLAPETAKAGTGFWELRHEPTGSTLSLRRWRSARVPQPELCELELRQRVAGIPEVDESNLVARRRVRAPAGFVTSLTLLSLSGRNARLRGQVLAIGAGVGECLAAIASTECSGEVELAERLRLFDAVLSHLRLSHIEDRVPAPNHPAR